MKWLVLIIVAPVFSLPIHPQFIEGEGDVQKSDYFLQVKATDRSIIHWDEFNIDPLETVQFSLPATASAVLNRVITNAPSQILGRITSNGQVLLINQAGVLVGKHAVIDTAKWVASTLDLQDRAFLEGDNWHFNGTSEATIQVEGKIHSNRVTVLAKNILAPGVFEGDQIDLVAGLRALVTGERVQTAGFAGDAVFACGKLDFSGSANAPTIALYGDQIDYSGSISGSSIQMGGSFQGKDPTILNASKIDMRGTIQTPRDGEVILFSDGICSFSGLIDSPNGFVEISGLQDLICKGIVYTDKTGTLLLDPNQITISTIPPTNPAPLTAVYDGSPLAASNVLDTDLTTLLGTTSVIIQTNGAIAGTGNIIVDADLTWFSGTSLTLQAHNSVLVNRLINPIGAGSLVDLRASQGDVVIQSAVGIPAGIQTDGLYALGATSVNIFCPNGSLTINSANDTETFILTNNVTSAGDIHVTSASMNFTAANASAMNANAGILARRGDVYLAVSGPVNFTSGNGTAFQNNANVVAGVNAVGSPIDGNIFFTIGSIHFNSSGASAGAFSATSFTAYGMTPGFGNVSGVVAGDVLVEGGLPIGCGSGFSALGGGAISITINGNMTMISSSGPTVAFSGTGFSTAFPGTAGPSNIDVVIRGDLLAISGGGTDSWAGFIANGDLNVDVGGRATFRVTNGTAASLSGIALVSVAASIQFVAGQAIFQGNAATPLASLISAPGNISIVTRQGLTLDFATASATGPNSSMNLRSTLDSIFINQGTTLSANGLLLVRAAKDIRMQGSFANSVADRVIFVVDEAFPQPFVGPGALFIDAASALNAPVGISLYTASQNLNSLLGLFNGSTFSAGALFVDTAREIWCTYFPNGISTLPFTVFYKECLSLLAYQASVSITEVLRNFHPYDEQLGWFQLMQLAREDATDPYFLRRRQIYLNHPKSWTVISH